MFTSKIDAFYRKGSSTRLCQCDIFKDLQFTISGQGSAGEDFELDYAIVISQDCDLKWDFDFREKERQKTGTRNHDKFLHTILIIPAYTFTKFCSGTHLGEAWNMQTFTSGREVEKLTSNTDFERYHYLPKDQNFSIPELVLDFKHYYSIPRNFLYEKKDKLYLATISEVFREKVSQRFSNYLSRIGAPDI